MRKTEIKDYLQKRQDMFEVDKKIRVSHESPKGIGSGQFEFRRTD
jgi:hypothetical protein